MKRITFALLLATLTLVAQAQTIQLQVSGAAPAEMKTIYLIDLQTGLPVDSMQPTGNRFRFERTTEQGLFFRVGSRDIMFALMSDATPVSINFNRGTLVGSPLNEKLHRYDLQTQQLEMAMQYAYMGGQNERLDSLRQAWRGVMTSAVEENQDNLLPAYYINELAYFTPYDKMKSLLSPDKPYSQHPMARQARTMLHDYELKMAGGPYIDLSMADSFGRQRSLSEWCARGKYVLLHFWSSDCGGYLQEMRRLAYCYGEFHPKGLEVVSISLDTNKQQWLRAINELHMVWPQLCDLRKPSAAVEVWGIHQLPQNVLVGPDGRILASNLYNGALEDKLEEIFGE